MRISYPIGSLVWRCSIGSQEADVGIIISNMKSNFKYEVSYSTGIEVNNVVMLHMQKKLAEEWTQQAIEILCGFNFKSMKRGDS